MAVDDILVTDVRNLPQLAPDYVIPGQKYRWYTSFDPIVAELHRQRMFCKKMHVKSSFRSEEDSARSHRPDRQTHD